MASAQSHPEISIWRRRWILGICLAIAAFFAGCAYFQNARILLYENSRIVTGTVIASDVHFRLSTLIPSRRTPHDRWRREVVYQYFDHTGAAHTFAASHVTDDLDEYLIGHTTRVRYPVSKPDRSIYRNIDSYRKSWLFLKYICMAVFLLFSFFSWRLYEVAPGDFLFSNEMPGSGNGVE